MLCDVQLVVLCDVNCSRMNSLGCISGHARPWSVSVSAAAAAGHAPRRQLSVECCSSHSVPCRLWVLQQRHLQQVLLSCSACSRVSSPQIGCIDQCLYVLPDQCLYILTSSVTSTIRARYPQHVLTVLTGGQHCHWITGIEWQQFGICMAHMSVMSHFLRAQVHQA